MRPRSIVACAFVAVALVAPTASAAQASPVTPTVSAAKVTKKTPKVKIVKPVRRKPVKVPFAVNGAVTGVDAAARTVTLAAKGGMRDLRGRTVTVTVATGARVVVDGAAGSLDSIEADYRIVVVGLRVGATLTATKISAVAPEVEAPETPETPAPTPSASPETPDTTS